MATVIKFPSQEDEANEVLCTALNELKEVLIIGTDINGFLFLSHNLKTRGEVIDLMKLTEYELYSIGDAE